MTAVEVREAARSSAAEVRREVARRRYLAWAALGVLAFGLFAVRVLLGDFTVTIPDFVRIVGGEDIPVASYVVMESKLPRAVAAMLCGVAFGVAGATFQTVLRNPLASPDVVGVSAGASLAAVVGVALLGWSGPALSALAVVGGLAAVVVLLVIARSRTGRVDVGRLVVGGIGLGAALVAGIQWVILRADLHSAQDALVWVAGSLSAAQWRDLAVLAAIEVVLLVVLARVARDLQVLELGSEVATGLGLGRAGERTLLVLAVLLVACATCVVGPVSFVALLAGPIAHRCTGRPSLVAAGLVGASVVLGADYVAAYALPDLNLPVGVVTGALGAPFLLWLVVRSTKVSS